MSINIIHAADIINIQRVFQYLNGIALGAPLFLNLFRIRGHFSVSLLGNALLGQLKHIELFLQCFGDDSSQLNIYIKSASR